MELYFILGFLGIMTLFIIFLTVKLMQLNLSKNNMSSDLARLEALNREESMRLRQELGQSLLQFNDSVRKSVSDRIDMMRNENTLNLNQMRQTVENKMDQMRTENTTKLEQMRSTVDEKLHDTLEKRISESFSLVSERLEKVHQGLGEMQSLASDVGGLKRVLTNVKARGTWGEVQLGVLLEQMLSAEQFIKNAHIKENVQEVVEYAVKLPDGDVLIPIDSKFPIEDYERLITATDNGDINAIETAGNELEKRIKLEAKRIADKYIYPPKTTDFAIMFLPTEGLYAEIMRRPGIAADIQNKYRVSIAGPSTLGAFLNSLQMGFRTLAIQKRSGEVWQILNEVKVEFEKYAGWVEKVKKNIELAHKTLDEAERRTRAVNRKLKSVENNLITDNVSPEIQQIPQQLVDTYSDNILHTETGTLI
ncbi:MAG: DNA recombination protein RmuC [Alphaproteobacteria bacterium]|nr:DNA recombination protein RmuC [Alphaproteobacteria bacterium]